MEKEEIVAPFIADIDPAFAVMRPAVRADLRAAEMEFRSCMRSMVDRLPPEIAAEMENLVVDCPAGFIKGLLPFFASINLLVAAAETLQAELQTQQPHVN